MQPAHRITRVVLATRTVAYGTTELPAGSRFWSEPCRTSPYPGLTFPRRSMRVAVTERGEPVPLHPGHVCLAQTETVTRRFAVDPAGELTDWLWVAPSVLADHVGDRAWHGRGDRWHARLRGADWLSLRRLFAAAERGGLPPAAFEAGALELLPAIARGLGHGAAHAPRTSSAVRRRRVFDAIGFLAGAIGRPFQLDEVARAVGLTSAHLCVVFREETGQTLTRYLCELRLARATLQLTRGAADLKELALDLGFSSHAHFSARFRAAFGTTPSEARRRLGGGGTGVPAAPRGAVSFRTDARVAIEELLFGSEGRGDLPIRSAAFDEKGAAPSIPS